ncbi:MAG: hypothetical protein ACQEUM_05735 [Pseudomonadota bacterium]
MSDLIDNALGVISDSDNDLVKSIALAGVVTAGVVYACKKVNVKLKVGKFETPFVKAENFEFKMNAEGKDSP